jgi:hypothetical protein
MHGSNQNQVALTRLEKAPNVCQGLRTVQFIGADAEADAECFTFTSQVPAMVEGYRDLLSPRGGQQRWMFEHIIIIR